MVITQALQEHGVEAMAYLLRASGMSKRMLDQKLKLLGHVLMYQRRALQGVARHHLSNHGLQPEMLQIGVKASARSD